LVSSDLNNYARITCYVYYAEIITSAPGIEALYIDHRYK
jgi:hypothetical protein